MSAGKIRERLLEILLERSFKTGSFTLASGRTSDYYIDCRTTTLHPEGANIIAELFVEHIKLRMEETGEKVDSVGGLTLGADPIIGALISKSHERGIPLRGFIVRKEAKGHGRGKLVEGCLAEGDAVIIIEDVVTTGGSAFKAISAVEDAGARVLEVIAVVDREEGGREALAEKGYGLYSLFSTSDLKAGASRA